MNKVTSDFAPIEMRSFQKREVPSLAHEVPSLAHEVPSLAHRVSLDPPKSAKKIKSPIRLLISKILILAWAVLCAVLLIGIVCRCYSYYSNKSLLEGIEKAQIQSVATSLSIVLTGPKRGEVAASPPEWSLKSLKDGILHAYRLKQGVLAGAETKAEAKWLAEQTLQIRKKIERFAKKKSVSDGMVSLQKDLTRVMENPLYQTIKAQDCEAVNFLQYIAIKRLAADGSKTLRKYGETCLGPLDKDAYCLIEFADLMSNHLKGYGFSYEGLNYVVYVACHPLTSMHCADSEWDPLGYDSSEGNPTFSGHTFEIGKKKMIFYYGPGPTGNPVFEHGVLPAYEKFNVFELRFNHQDTIKASEYERIKEIKRMANENPKVLRHALLGFDTKMEKNQDIEYKNATLFFEPYTKYVKEGVRGNESQKEHSGFDIPFHMLSDEEIDKALLQAKDFCKKMSKDNPFWEQMMQLQGPSSFTEYCDYMWHSTLGDPKALYSLNHPGKARMAKMMQLVTDTYLTLGMIYRSLDAISPEMVQRSLDEKLDKDLTALRTSGACKQDVDRAVIENISLRLFFRWASNPAPLTRDEVYEIAGAVFGRARLVDDRKIIQRRYQILDDLLRFIGSHPGGVEVAHSLLKEYQETLNPSRFERLKRYVLS